jgi:hypothetical protein
MRNQYKIKITHAGVEITYLEDTNKWNFELRGRERNADSLQAAIDVIDTPEPIKKNPLVRYTAFIHPYSWDGTGTFETVTVTSVAEGAASQPHVWVLHADKKREKIRVDRVFASTPENEAAMREYLVTNAAITRLRKAQETLLESMKLIEVPRG